MRTQVFPPRSAAVCAIHCVRRGAPRRGPDAPVGALCGPFRLDYLQNDADLLVLVGRLGALAKSSGDAGLVHPTRNRACERTLAGLGQTDRLAAFFLCWFGITLLPVLPLRDHLSEYYTFIPTIGLAMAGGWGLVRAWRHGRAYRAVALLVTALYLAVSLPQAYAMSDWLYWRSLRVKSLLLSVARARALHPEHTIVLDGVDEHLFLSGILNRPFGLVGVGEVYLTPENAKSIEAKPDWGNPREYALPEGVMARALERGEVAVYRVEDWRLRNITTGYTVTFQAGSDSASAKSRTRQPGDGIPAGPHLVPGR